MTMQNTNPQANAPKPTLVKKTWQEMSKAERHDFSLTKKVQAIEKVKEGDFPSAVRIKLGEHTLFAKPSGVSEKGSVSYSVNPTILTLGTKQVRINKINVSVLNSQMEGLEDLELTADNIL